ncbi:YrhB domain-containing protein [Nonomuraea insulae]|uniref:YrhB domain-containing protein n=1 Tax=Nonomuraea insulae TaxID=1616787 RepID=A0ABW1CKN0_9ACTN
MIDREHAVRLIEELLRADRETVDRHGHAIPLTITRVTEHRLGWIVSYQSQAYLRSGSISDLLGGNGPYLVDRHDGSIHLIPVTDYVAGLWEEDYEQHIKPIGSVENDPRRDIPFATEVRAALGDGRVAAIRLLRRRAPILNMAQASDYVVAIGTGERPTAELIELVRPPEPFSPRLGITTITAPLLSATDPPEPGSASPSAQGRRRNEE